MNPLRLLSCSLIVTTFLLLFPRILIGIPEQPHHTTAYIGNPGQLDLLPSMTYYSTKHFWNKKGEKLKAFYHFQRWSALMYGEYAINTTRSITINGGYSRVLDSLNGNTQGFEDLELGIKQALYKHNTLAITAQILAILPLAKSKSSIRYGKIGGEIALFCSNQFQLFNHCAWYDFSLGYRAYQGFPSNQIRTALALGYALSTRSYLIASSQLCYGLTNHTLRWRSNPIVNNPNYRLLNMQIEYLINIFHHMTATLGVFGHLWGRHIGTGGGCFVGTWIDF